MSHDEIVRVERTTINYDDMTLSTIHVAEVHTCESKSSHCGIDIHNDNAGVY